MSLIPTALEVLKFCGSSVIIKEDKKYFDWPGFKKHVDDYKGDDLSFDFFKDTNLSYDEVKVSIMVKDIVAFLKNALKVVVDAQFFEDLRATIEATFTHLKKASEDGWASFSHKTGASNSSWEYRLLFANPADELPDYFFTLVTTIKLTASIIEESSWWGLESSTSKDFSAAIDTMELVVRKGFKAKN